MAYQIDGDDEQNRMHVKFSAVKLVTLGKCQMSLNFDYHVNTKIFYTKLCVRSYKQKIIKHIEQNFHSVAEVMPQGWDLGVLSGSNT